MTLTIVVALASSAFSAATASIGQSAKPFQVMVGDPAPPLRVHWVRGDPVRKLITGRVYVVDFWATWCAPCIEAMPHLTALQAKYTGKVTFIGVSVWERVQAGVKPFALKMRQKMGYGVAMDIVPAPKKNQDLPWSGDDGVMSQSWLHASGEFTYGIPRSIIVDRNGRVAWMGPPSGLDEPLAKVVAGTWKIAAEQQREFPIAVKLAAGIGFRAQFDLAMRQGTYARAVDACEKLLRLDEQANADYASEKFCVLLTKLHETKKAYDYAPDAIRIGDKDGYALWKIGDAIVNLSGTASDRNLDLAMRAAMRSNELGEGKVDWYLDLLAHVNALKGDYKSAAQLEAAAVAHARPSNAKPFQTALDGYKKRVG